MNHLWQSTMFAAAAGLLTLAFQRNRAPVRYWLWFSASFKFLVPFALLMSLGRLVPLRSLDLIDRAIVPVAVEQIAQELPKALRPGPASHRSFDWLPIVWACGFTAVVGVRFRGWLRVRAAVRASTPIDIPAEVVVRSSPVLLEPGVVGLWRQMLLLPAGIAERLTPSQLDAVVAHELCHVHRRDNLLAAIHMVVEAVFWFHPLVWWIGARLVEERERACDEEVLRLGIAPHDYAEAILDVCKLYIGSPLACVAGIAGANIKRRIEAILTNHEAPGLSVAKKAVLAVAGAAALAAPLIIAMAIPGFAVASVKPRTGCAAMGMSSGDSSAGGLKLGCWPLPAIVWKTYMEFAAGKREPREAYWMLPADSTGVRRKAPIEGAPEWFNSANYDIDAVAHPGAAESIKHGPMMQALLEETFQLKIHRETRDVPVYELKLAGGPNFQKCIAPHSTRPVEFWISRCQTMADFSRSITRLSDRNIVDRTGLSGTYEIRLRPAIRRGETTVPVLRMELQELGLTIEPGTGSVEILVIDHIERPAEN